MVSGQEKRRCSPTNRTGKKPRRKDVVTLQIHLLARWDTFLHHLESVLLCHE